MTIFAADDFNRSDRALLNDTASDGGTWEQWESGDTTDIKIVGNECTTGDSASHYLIHSGVADDNDMTVTVACDPNGDKVRFGLVVHAGLSGTSQKTGYYCWRDTSVNRWQMYRAEGDGTSTRIYNSAPTTVGDAAPDVLEFDGTVGALVMYFAGSAVTSVQPDSTYTAGQAGMVWGGGSGATAGQVPAYYDNFSAETPVASGGAALASSVSCAATTAGALTTQVKLAATASATATTSAALSTPVELASAVSVTTAASAALSTQVRLASSVAASVNATAALTVEGGAAALSAAVTASANATAALTTELRLVADATASAIATAALTTTAIGAALASSVTASASAAAALTTEIRFASSVSASASVAAALTTEIVMAAVANAVATASVALTVSGGTPGRYEQSTIVKVASDRTVVVSQSPERTTIVTKQPQLV